MSDKRTHIEDLDDVKNPTDLGDAEAEKVSGGLVRPVVGGGEQTAIDTTYSNGTHGTDYKQD